MLPDEVSCDEHCEGSSIKTEWHDFRSHANSAERVKMAMSCRLRPVNQFGFVSLKETVFAFNLRSLEDFMQGARM